ncbi:DUF2779 domain-containing protein [Candidatus Nitrospira bockiana]
MIGIPSRPAVLPSSVRLSKSKFVAGLQCHKRLYLEVHAPELATPPDASTQAILDMGTEIGSLARRRFPGGILVEADHRHSTDALMRTQALVEDPTVAAIFEGAFVFEHILIRVDVLERVADVDGGTAWRLIEVKSATRVKEVHIEDLALQAYVLNGLGFRLAASCLMHINTQYVFDGGAVDLMQLFALQDVSGPVALKQPSVALRLAAMKTMLAQPAPPAITPGSHCQVPYDCPFWDFCTKDKPERWIFHLPGGDQTFQALVRLGVETIDEIPTGFSLSIPQRRMKENVEWVSPGLKTLLETVRYPVHHLDFETFMPAVPKFPRTRPYQTIPTQWSNHIEQGDGTVEHREHLHLDPRDPREDLVAALLDALGHEGSICVYSGYERAILERLAEAFPTLRDDLLRVIGRLWDLFPIIRDHYYHPGFSGSYSIKAVLPAVVPTLGYDDLDIRDGGTAAQAYYRMVFEETDLIEKIRLREALLQYCARDTLAMVELRRALYRRCVER